VEDIARDPRLFTFLQNTAGHIGVEIGDGRRKLEEAAPASFDLIVVDAFSSDTVPAHLMTTEAWQMYLTRLAPGGVIALHISNRYVDLEPVVAANAAMTHVFALTRLAAQVPPAELAAAELRRSGWW
jgi:spermidine synthase